MNKSYYDIPTFCPDCKQYTLERNIKRDVYSENKKLLWLAYTCPICGHVALEPA